MQLVLESHSDPNDDIVEAQLNQDGLLGFGYSPLSLQLTLRRAMKQKSRVFFVGSPSNRSRSKTLGNHVNEATRKLEDLLNPGRKMRQSFQHMSASMHSVAADVHAGGFHKQVSLHGG